VRLTRPALANLALPPGRSELIVFDDTLPGFGVRLRAGGKRVWIAQYRMGQKQRRVTIGSVETLDPDQARRAAKSILAKVHLGSDPQAAKSEAKARAHLTLGAMIEPYLEFASRRLKPRTFVETSRTCERPGSRCTASPSRRSPAERLLFSSRSLPWQTALLRRTGLASPSRHSLPGPCGKGWLILTQ
jgi:hypothetical protein